jgi:hypothetical protein
MGNKCCCCFKWASREQVFQDNLYEKLVQYDAYVDEDDLIDENDMYQSCNFDFSATYDPFSMSL